MLKKNLRLVVFLLVAVSVGAIGYTVRAGTLEFDGVPVDITTSSSEDLVIVPGSGGNVQIGDASGTNTYATTNDDLHITGKVETDGAAYFDGALTAAAGITSGSNIVSDTDSTDNLGTSSVAWSNLFVDTIATTSATDLSLSPASGSGIDGSVTRSASTGNEVAYDLATTINKATSGDYTGIKLNVTETSAPGTDDRLLDLQVAGSSKFYVDNAGNVTVVGTLTATTISGGGDVTGPSSSTDNAVPRFDGAGGKTLQSSSVIISDTDNVSGIGTLAAGATTITSLDVTEGNITNVTDIALDTISADAANGSVTVTLDNASGADFIVGNNSALVVEGDDDQVGIGTTAPGANLEISATGSPTLKITSTDNEFPQLHLQRGAFETDEFGDLSLLNSGSNFHIKSHASSSSTYRFTLMGTGNVGIGTDTTPDYLLELHDATNTPDFALSDDDIAHGVTTLAQTDVFGHLSSISTTVGGLQLTALADATGIALGLKGVQSSDPTDTTPAISLIAAKASGTGVVDLGAAETVFQVANNDDTAAITVLGNGRVGIGVVAPNDELEVEGDIRSNESIYYDAELDNGNSSTADTIDWGVGNKQKSTLTDNCTFTFTAPAGPCNLVFKLIQDGTGSRTVTWPDTVKWPAGTAPTLTTSASTTDIICFYYDGTNYYAVSSLNFS